MTGPLEGTRRLLGARAAGYPDTEPGTVPGFVDHEKRIGRRAHLFQAFGRPDRLPLENKDERQLALRDDTWLLQCWKPAGRWADAAGKTAATTARIDKVAARFAELDKPAFLVLHHEPENDVGKAGTAAEYRAMWWHIRHRFAEAGADNVIWGIGFMNYPKWDHLVPELIPHEDLIDMVWFNAYGSKASPGYAANVGRFTQLADSISKPGGDLMSKPWGVREWSISGVPEQTQTQYFNDAARVGLDDDSNVRAHVVFDSPGVENNRALRVGYTEAGPSKAKAAAYRAFVHDQAFGPVVAA